MLPAAEGRLGHAAGDARRPCPAMTPTSRRTAPKPADHGEARLRAGQTARDQGVDAQLPGLARSGGDPDRPAEGNLYRRRARTRRYRAWYPKMMRKDFTVGLNVSESGVDDPDQHVLRELCLRRGAQLHRLLQSRGRQADRPAIGEADQEKRKADGVGDRAKDWPKTVPGRSSSTPGGDLPAARSRG